MRKITADFDALLASVPVDRVAARVTYQGRTEPEPVPNIFARKEVPAPVVGEGSVTVMTSNFRADKLRARIRELERQLQRKLLPKAERKVLGRQKHALSEAIRQSRDVRQQKGNERVVAMGYVR